MSHDVKTLQSMMRPFGDDESLIDSLVEDYEQMASARAPWEAEVNEVMAYVSATDTRTTTNSKLPFKNSTTINKISQIRQNIVTSYMEHLLPNSNWVQWQALSEEDADKERRKVIESYVRSKVLQSGAEAEIERLVDDYTIAGIAIAMNRHVVKTQKDELGNDQIIYQGAVTERINFWDFFYDVTASNLDVARKCIRSVYTIGGLKKHVRETGGILTPEQFEQVLQLRKEVRSSIVEDHNGNRKRQSLVRAGFGDMMNYIENGTVEVLRFFGDFYDMEKDELLENYEIVVVDRRIIAKKAPVESWSGSSHLHISVWEYRENTIAPMGPLARIVGLQYKVDKLENLRADIFDKIADPPTVEIGEVRKHGVRGAPGFRYEVDEGGDVKYLQPPVQALNADMQIQFTLQLMEELSGAPREAVGQRTPGEKTKFEVQLLDQGQGKLFRRKVKKFEMELMSPILQDFLELGRINLSATDVIATINDELGVQIFTEITRENLSGMGRVVARGASIFAERANALQNLVTLSQTPLFQMTQQHWSRIKLARTLEELGDLAKYKMVLENIGMQEDAKTQKFAQTLQDGNMAASVNDGNVTDEPIEE